MSTVSFALFFLLVSHRASAQLKHNFYADTCPEAETVVRKVVTKMSTSAIPETIRLVLHDCFVEGCDASILIESNGTHKAGKDHPENLSLVNTDFGTVIKAKATVDSIPGCNNKVSCADILVMAVRDSIALVNIEQ